MAVTSRYRPADHRQRRLEWLLMARFVVILGRVLQLQTISRQHYVENVGAIIDRHRTPLGPQPGAILARDLQPLAESLFLKTCVANPRMMADEGESLHGVAEQLAPILKRPETELFTKLDERRDRRYVEVAPFLHEPVADRIKALKIKGLDLVPEWKREYPQGPLACHIVGGRDRYHHARGGLEHLYSALLEPQQGAGTVNRGGAWTYADGGARPEPGRDLVLTIDLGLQRHVEAELDRVMQRERAEWVCGVVMDPQTGAILALGSRPAYDPNRSVEPQTRSRQRRAPAPARPRNRTRDWTRENVAVTAAVEQGSTFKVLLATAALEAGVVTPESTFHCGGHINIGGRPISCWGRYAATGHGALNIYGMIGQSCNCIAAQVAGRLGAKRYCEFLKRAGIGSDPEAGFPAEAFGLLPPTERIRPRDLATMGFGQNVSCSGLQLTAAVAGIVNDGVMKQPHVLDAVLNSDGSTFRRPAVRETRLCSPATSATMRAMLQYAVEHGTGAAVRMPDFPVGGKTGTAQQWDFEHHCHYTDRYMVSFVEVAPIDQPRYVIYIACNWPKVGRHGSDVAAPSCKRIAEYALHRLGRAPAPASPAAPGPATSTQ